MYQAIIGVITDEKERAAIDRIRNWANSYFKADLEARPSLHRYTKTLPEAVRQDIEVLRRSPEVMANVGAQYGSVPEVTPLDDTDEFYISHYNLDKGGDQGLFDKHYDGNLRFVDGATVVRALIYISADDEYVVHFQDTGISHNFKTYEYGILDFHRELHWVAGSYQAGGTPRMLLKLNYLICSDCSPVYKTTVATMNRWVFFIVKACMEYSKSPQTPAQHLIGFLCNMFRELNIVNPLLPILLIVVVIAAIILCIFVAMWRSKVLVKAAKPRSRR